MKLFCKVVENGNVGAPSGSYEIVDHVVDLPAEDGAYVLATTDLYTEYKDDAEGELITKVVKPDVIKRGRAK